MPRKSRFFSGGFIDILSLVAVVFLIITTLTGVIVVNKDNANFDIRNKAMSTEGGGTGGYVAPKKTTTKTTTTTTTPVTQTPVTQTQPQTQTVTPPQTTVTTPNTPAKANTPSCAVVRLNTAGTCPDGKTIKYVWQNADCSQTTDTCTGSQNTPGCTAGTVINTAGTCPDGKTIKYVRLNTDCKTTTTDTCSDSPTVPPSPPITQTETVTPTQTTASYVPDDTCLYPGQSCRNGNYFDSSCAVTETRCGTKPAQTTSTATNTITTTQTSTTPSCSTFGVCYPNTYTCEKSYGQINCGTNNKCGTHCSAPVSASVPVAISQTLKIYGDTCTGDSQCSSGSCKQKTTALPTKYCVDPNAGLTTTYNALNAVTFGTFGNYVNTYQNVNAQNPQASYLERAFDPTIVPTYNTLNTLTFGTFGNYVQTNQNINASNPEASYFERAFNLQNLSASAKLGTVLTAEGAILVAAAPYAVPVLTGANVVDDTVTVAQCIAGDQNACAMAIPTLLSPIPGTGLADDISDFTHTWDLVTPNRMPTVGTNLLVSVESANGFHPTSVSDIQGPSLGTVIDEPLSIPNRNILASQMTGKLPSETGSSLAQEARQLMNNEGLDQATAITRVVNENTTYHVGSGPVPADAARSIEQSICLPGQCRNISQISTTVANNMDVNAEFSTFYTRDLMTGETKGHAVTPFINSAGAYGIIDATNGVSFNTVDEYVNWLTSRGYTPATDIMGNISGSTIYQIPTGVQDVPAVNDLTMPTTVRDVPTTENLTGPTVETVAPPAQKSVSQPDFLEGIRNTFFGESKTVNTSKLNQGDTITLFPGDKTSGILTTGESRVPELSPDLKYYWSTSDDSTIHELTENGITVTTKSGTTVVYIDSDPVVRGGDSPYEIVITTGKDVPVIITRASAEPGIFTLRDSEGNWFPGIRKLFTNQ